MLSFTSAQLDAWLAMLAYPLARILGLVSTAPIFGNDGIPRRMRLLAGLAIAIGLAPDLPAVPSVPLGSWDGLLIIGQQSLIGLAMGLTMRIVLAALELMGELVSLQMGLSFATFFDPMAGGQTAVVGQFLTLMSSLIFLALNGHLLLVDALARSFEWLPITAAPVRGDGWLLLARSGAIIFGSGLLMALPIVTALLITNIALGILTKAAPQLNLFAIGFPITLTVGLGMLVMTLERMGPLLQRLYDMGFESMAQVVRGTL